LFYFLSKLNPTLRTAKLPSELLTQKDRMIKVRVGKPITVAEQNEHSTIEDYSEFLRKKTYMLANSFDEESNFLSDLNHLQLKIPKVRNKLRRLPIRIKWLAEIESLRHSDSRLTHSKNYEVFFTEAHKIPNILHEIGRLREVTFREIGEGTNELD
jgi:hypothetical protein